MSVPRFAEPVPSSSATSPNLTSPYPRKYPPQGVIYVVRETKNLHAYVANHKGVMPYQFAPKKLTLHLLVGSKVFFFIIPQPTNPASVS